MLAAGGCDLREALVKELRRGLKKLFRPLGMVVPLKRDALLVPRVFGVEVIAVVRRDKGVLSGKGESDGANCGALCQAEASSPVANKAGM